jgi:glutamine synthetase
MDAQAIVAQAREANVRLVRFMYCDNGGIIRGKAAHVNGLAQRMAEGIGQTLAMQAFAGIDALAAVAGMGPIGEFRLVPDPETFVVLPFAPNSAMMLCDLIAQDQQPWAACPRTFLKRMMAAAAARRIAVEAAVEHEFYLARETATGFEPFDHSLCYSSIGFESSAAIIDDIIHTLELEGIPVEQFVPELGPGQQELSIHHANVLRAADTALIVRDTVRGVARQHGLFASFAAKPFLDQAGSGAHIHFSLWGTPGSPEAGRNLLYDAQGSGGLSALGRHAIGGVMRHLPGLLALTCASPNSYRRLQPHFWSSAYTIYGFDNREGAIRVPSTFWGREEATTNLELKPVDHSGNPYLAMGGLIAAALDGIANELDPGEPTEIDPGVLSDDERAQRGIQRLPQSLDVALDALQSDTVLLEALGPTLATAYVAVKRLESQYFTGKAPDVETLAHFYKY